MISLNQFPKFFLAIFLLLTIACNNDDGDDGIAITDGCTASWKLDGTSFNEDLNLCVNLDNTLNLSTSLTGGSFQLQIDPIFETGTYLADPTNPDVNVFINLRQDDGSQLLIKNGQVTVTELSSSKAKGTFSGNFYEIMDLNQDAVFSVTDGKFEANF